MLENTNLWRIKHKFQSRKIQDLPAAVAAEMAAAWPKANIQTGQRVAITVGSRGIANLAVIVKTMCAEIKARGALPVLIPAMGSHGGATPAGQRRILADYGLTEETSGAEIDDRMETQKIGVTPEGVEVFMAQSALDVDHIIVFNRVKPHTDFKGAVESGLCKMMAIGLGKRVGAEYYHRSIIDLGLDHAIEAAGRFVVENCKIAFGLATVEDSYDDTAIVRHLMPQELVEEEKAILNTAREYMASLPFDAIDVLIIDRIGKNISGTGMDTNIIGRFKNIYTKEDLPRPVIKRIYVRDLTDEAHGNACGMGRADFVSKKLYDKIDFESTYLNCLTALGLENARLPIVRKDDRQALSDLVSSVGLIASDKLKLVWIKDTLSLSDIIVSEAFIEECRKRDELEPVEKITPEFDAEGYVRPFWSEGEHH